MTRTESLEINQAMINLATVIIERELTEEVGEEFSNLSDIVIAIMEKYREEDE